MAKDYRSRFADFKTVEAEKDELLQVGSIVLLVWGLVFTTEDY